MYMNSKDLSRLEILTKVLQIDAYALFGDVDPNAPILEKIPERSPILLSPAPNGVFRYAKRNFYNKKRKQSVSTKIFCVPKPLRSPHSPFSSQDLFIKADSTDS